MGEAARILQHEVLAHYSLNLFEPTVKRAILQTVEKETHSIAEAVVGQSFLTSLDATEDMQVY